MNPATEIVEAEGHLIDSQLLNAMFDTVVRHDGAFEVLEFRIGRTNDEPSFVSMRVTAGGDGALTELLEELVTLGCRVARIEDAHVAPADRDGCAPEDFYSTTNHQTFVRLGGAWVAVDHQRMDAAIVCDASGGGAPRAVNTASCRKLRDIQRGDLVVCGVQGVKIVPEFRARDRHGFAFMTNEISSERRVEVAVAKIAAMMKDAKAAGERIAFVAGPVVVHTGGGAYFCDLIRRGYVDVLLAGNALAVHDAEQAIFGTSLGVDLETGKAIEGGHRHHMRAINAIFRAGGLKAAVDSGVLKSGVMHECIRRGVDYVLAGSIRDDGPLPDTVMNLVDAQDRYTEALKGVSLVLVLSTMLHGIGVGNMLPSWVRLVCVDINPAVVTKLADRGSSQTMGMVTDVGLFLRQLASAL
ncbi:MAG TPA: TIGR00300 family protein [Vicinamibacterales bacterium]|jgi:lysine-ketoglutarate reductase/saccharopine dehydrogenase-like protein (TIGR00300 family)|nr:TIGR00300 family protein [Vicinamibacterales bacterium]